MITWENLLDGYDPYADIFGPDDQTLQQILDTRLIQHFYIELLHMIFPLIWFIVYALASSALLLIVYFALWYLFTMPLFISLAQLWRFKKK